MIGRFNITYLLGGALGLMALAACEGVVDQVKASQTAQLVGLVLDQPCVLTPREGRRLSGAYMRQPAVTPTAFDPIFITGRESRGGLPRSIVFDDTAVRRLRPDAETGGLEGSRRSEAAPRPGFAPTDALPNVYDLNYRAARIDYTGALVVGNSMAAFEIPTSGAQTFSGRIDVTLTTPLGDGTTSQTTTGTFTLTAGYGSKRAQFRAEGLGAGLPFDSLSWSNLYLCGTRFVSSGGGQVKVQTGTAPPVFPFQGGRAPVPLRAIFESTLFAPEDRPAGPEAFGGVLVVQSDVGTITAVFLDPLPEAAGS